MEGVANRAYVGDAPRDSHDEVSDKNVTKIKLQNSSEPHDKPTYQLWKVIVPFVFILCATIIPLIYFAVMYVQNREGKNIYFLYLVPIGQHIK